ncbi:MAG: hypothetical protein KKD86_17190 [Bacteroidetes bacterium]|nr:hypothetical protein [Bacteroidota bacterium]
MKKLFLLLRHFLVISVLLSNSIFGYYQSIDSNVFLGNENISRNNIVAEVGDVCITVEEFLNSYEFGPAFVKRLPNSKQKYLQYMINEKLLALKGYELELDKNETAEEMYTAIFSDLITEELFREDILSKIIIDQSEIDTIVAMKNLQLEISWLYSDDAEKINEYWISLKKGVAFDSLLQSQLSDSIFLDMRSMKTNRYSLGEKNAALAGMLDTLKVGAYSFPIHTDDGWYIVKFNNVSQNIITSESEYNKLVYESNQSAIKNKMDLESDKYVESMMNNVSPIIKRNAFIVVRSYLGQFVLPKEKFDEWQLQKELDKVMPEFGEVDEKSFPQIPLIQFTDGQKSISEFLVWFRSRSQYIKFNKTDLRSFSASLEKLIWRMLRDELLTAEAIARGIDKRESVKNQARWWKDKIVHSTLINYLSRSIQLSREEQNFSDDNKDMTEEEYLNYEMTKKVFRQLNDYKKKYAVKINDSVLEDISVSAENDPRAIDLYTVKKGGLIPRTPYPVIDTFWNLWE